MVKSAAPDQQQKKIVFKIANQLKDTQNKVSLDAIWKRFMGMTDRETMRSGTTEPLINNKDELVWIIEDLEKDNLCLYAAEDN